MNEENRKKLWSLIQSHGDIIKDKLKPHPYHPRGRNPYAHICTIIKSQYNLSYKEISDEKFSELCNLIKNIKS